jgi:eukaryotic-like serine/threonine-protein kinase
MGRHEPERLAELFDHALALPREDRQGYAIAACADDPQLLDELLSLLAAHEEAPDCLERLANLLRPAALAATESFGPLPSPGREIAFDARLRAGQRFGHYDVERFLGSGGMGEVWEAQDLDTGRHVALKTLGRTLSGAAERARFLREGRLAARVNHPNIVYVFAAEEIQGVPVIAMELASGGTLKDLVAATGPLQTVQAVDAVLQIIAGLEATAAAGVLHGDIKPSNCFVDAEERIKVGDFGIAAAIQYEATLTGGVLATPTFASPEQLRGEALDVRSDIYAVGATLYYLLTGGPPFEDANVARLIDRVLHQRPASVRAVRRDVPRTLAGIIQQCLAKDLRERPHSYGQLTRLLLLHGSAQPAPAPLGLRALAGILDGMFVRIAGGVLPFLALTQWQQRVPADPLEWFAFIGLHSVLLVVYFGVSEGLWSASPGKMVVGLRVIRTDRQPLSVGCSLARACLWWLSLTPGLLTWVALWPSELGAAAWSAGWPAYLATLGTTLTGIGTLFARARRRNGFAGLHDLATRTRVVSKLAYEPLSRRAAAQESTPMAPATATRLGPYVVLDESAPPGVLVGFDQQLARRVWIRRAPPGTPAVSKTRRSVSRPTRLRWIAGGRDTDSGWDAYERAEGEPFRRAIHRPRTWGIVRGWLHDIAQEMTAAGEDGTDLALDFDRLWVADGRVRILDWLPEGAEGSIESAEPVNSLHVQRAQRFLYDVAMLGLRIEQPCLNRAADPAAALPLHARELFHDLASERFDTKTAIVERLRSLATKPVTLTRARRCAHLAICGAAPLISILVAIPVLVVLLPMLAQSPDAFVLDACLRRLERLERSSDAEAVRERTAIEAYLVGRFRPLLTEHPTSTKPWFWPMIEVRQSAVQRALARQPNPSDEDIERAAHQLAGLVGAAQRDRELAARGLLGWRLMLFAVLLLIVVSALPAVLSACFARGGAVLGLLGIAVVAEDGREVSRSRGFARGMIAWTPGIAALVLLLPFTTQQSMEAVPLQQLAPSLLLLAVFVAGAIFALFDVQRGVQDRITRTTLVAR